MNKRGENMEEFITLFDQVYEKIMDKYYQTIKEETIAFSLTEREERYLNIIYKNYTITLSEFAEKSKITKPAATQIINAFVEKGYVIKTISATDKRVYHVALTKEMKKYIEKSYEKLDALYKECLSLITKQELEMLNTILHKINNSI